METDVKPWYASKAMWGGIIAVLAGLAGLWGYKISPADQEQIILLVTGLSSAVGGVLSIVGRIMATKSLK